MPDDRDEDSLEPEAAFWMVLGIAREVSGLVNAGRLRGFTRTEIGAELKQELPKGKHFFRYAGGMYVRARGYYRSGLILLQHRLADEALALGRSLFEDSLRLDILMNLPDDRRRVDAVVRWALDGVTRDIGLLHEAKRSQVGWDHELGVDALEQQRDRLVQLRARHGSEEVTRRDFFSEQALKQRALNSDRAHSWWMHEVGDQMVHGNLYSHRMRSHEEGDLLLLAMDYSDHPTALVDVAAYLVESIVVSHRAICSLLDYESAEAIDAHLAEIEAIQTRLGEPSSVRIEEE